MLQDWAVTVAAALHKLAGMNRTGRLMNLTPAELLKRDKKPESRSMVARAGETDCRSGEGLLGWCLHVPANKTQ